MSLFILGGQQTLEVRPYGWAALIGSLSNKMNPMDGNNGLGLGLDFINNVSILVAQLLFGWIGGLGQEEFVGCLGLNRKGIYN
jgi:hypothetical protein